MTDTNPSHNCVGTPFASPLPPAAGFLFEDRLATCTLESYHSVRKKQTMKPGMTTVCVTYQDINTIMYLPLACLQYFLETL